MHLGRRRLWPHRALKCTASAHLSWCARKFVLRCVCKLVFCALVARDVCAAASDHASASQLRVSHMPLVTLPRTTIAVASERTSQPIPYELTGLSRCTLCWERVCMCVSVCPKPCWPLIHPPAQQEALHRSHSGRDAPEATVPDQQPRQP
eukprot:1175868-Prorocentrum_minimum.AAC.4